MKRTIKLMPADVLFFRDSKPFTMESDHYAHSTFPPMPQTVYGALRSAAMQAQNYDFTAFAQGSVMRQDGRPVDESAKRELGSKESPGTFVQQGPFVADSGGCLYFTAPFDLKKVQNGRRRQRTVCALKAFPWNKKTGMRFDTDLCADFPHLAQPNPLEDFSGMVSQDGLRSYCLGNYNVVAERKHEEFVCYESRTGLGIDREKNSAKSGLLYSVDFVRLRNGMNLVTGVENLSSLPAQGVLMLGGRNRFCDYAATDNRDVLAVFKDDTEQRICELVKRTLLFKIILLTPAVFSAGWLFGKWSENGTCKAKTPSGAKFEVLSAAIGRAGTVSGWDLAAKKAKPLKKLVPSGSVYYCKLETQAMVDGLFKDIHCAAVSDEMPNLGYGISLIGGLEQ